MQYCNNFAMSKMPQIHVMCVMTLTSYDYENIKPKSEYYKLLLNYYKDAILSEAIFSIPVIQIVCWETWWPNG